MISGLNDELSINICTIFRKYDNLHKVILYGSRARGDYEDNSDIDLALVYSNDSLLYLKINTDLEELDTLLKFDVIDYNKVTNVRLKANIDSEGVVIYDSHAFSSSTCLE